VKGIEDAFPHLPVFEHIDMIEWDDLI